MNSSNQFVDGQSYVSFNLCKEDRIKGIGDKFKKLLDSNAPDVIHIPWAGERLNISDKFSLSYCDDHSVQDCLSIDTKVAYVSSQIESVGGCVVRTQHYYMEDDFFSLHESGEFEEDLLWTKEVTNMLITLGAYINRKRIVPSLFIT